MSRAQLLWALFAWVGIPILFMICVLLIALPFRSQGVLLSTTLGFVACGTWAVAKGQRPHRSWIVLLYPIPMFFLLAFIMTAMVLLGPRGV
jgi:hypothetical protein